ncbi:MAG: DUF4297 domain-containing protein [Gammaproteobacteria bacterium]|nr:DUF4297 domain-containing protein [Gammaproteobacteria bacterium]
MKSDNNNELTKTLLSIDDDAPEDLGGVYARQGFAYQDDVAAHFLIEMLKNEELTEVRCETNEDITNIWVRNNNRIAEYVQVKAEHLDQLWTISPLAQRKSSTIKPSGVGTSILEKNFSWDKYIEDSLFRIVTCRQVSNELKPLTYSRDAAIRNQEGNNDAVRDKLQIKLSDFRSEKGNGIEYWVENAEWLVLDDNNIQDINKTKLNINLHQLGIEVNPEKLNEIYDALRTLVKEKAELGRKDWKDKKITKAYLIEYIKNANDPFPDKSKSEKLEKKILAAGLDNTYVKTAREQQREYLKNKRESRYFTHEKTSNIDTAILSRLHGLRSSLDSGELSDSPGEFYNRCLKEIKQAGKNASAFDSDLANAYYEGCMHEVTSRCMHRYKKITS